jgi:MinD superfamily P-loop ATPase containing an inserted ferredoxin domain
MKRKIIKIDNEKCNGCELCATACHEGAIKMVNGKAKLIRDDYCDGLGDCLPVCPTNAISFEEREALPYDEEAVKKHMAARQEPKQSTSMLRQWPVQIKLVSVQAPFLKNAHLLIAADCTAFAYGNFHSDFIRDKVVLVGCPKLDMEDYSQKLTDILRENEIASVQVVRMEVPCCGGIEYAVTQAVENSKKEVPCEVVTISVDGEIL